MHNHDLVPHKEIAAPVEGQEGMILGTSIAGEPAFLSLRQIGPAMLLTHAFTVDESQVVNHDPLYWGPVPVCPP